MTWEGWTALVILALLLFALARNLAGADILLGGAAAVFALLSSFSNKFPSVREVAAGFGNEGLLTVATLFVLTAGLRETGALSMVAGALLGRPRTVAGAQARLMIPTATASAFINNTPVVAMMIPAVTEWCRKIGVSPAKVMIPLSYAAVLGGVLTLIGTSTNLIVHGLMIAAAKTDPAMPRFGFWTIGAVGLPCALAGLVFILLCARRLLPDRSAVDVSHDDPRQYTVEMLVEPGGAIDGRTIEQAGLRNLPTVYLMEVQRDDGQTTIPAVGPQEVLRGGDRLIFVGVVDSVVDLHRTRGLTPATNQVFKLQDPRHRRVLIEAVVGSGCPLAGKGIREGRFRTRYDAAVIAVHRDGERVRQKIGDIVLRPGDTLLLEAHPRFADQWRDSRDFLLVSPIAGSAPRRHERAWVALLILVGTIVAMTFEAKIPVLTTAMVAAGLMLVTRCCTGDQARRSVDWSTLVAIGASFGVGKAIQTTGAAEFVSQTVLGPLQNLGPWAALLGIYFLTLLFTELVSNNAAAALAFPIAHATAGAMGVDFMPFAVCLAIAASCGFATPLGYQTHLMVYGPGGYRMSDFMRIGLPLDGIVMLVAVAVAPMVFPFHP
jgi:di/tricarboxylate transporter